MKAYLSIVLLLSSILFSCNKIDLQEADTNVPVVECYLNSDQEISVKIVKQLVYESNDTSLTYLDDLEVYIYNDDNSYLLTSIDSGIYVNEDLEILSSMQYDIGFTYNDKLVSATTTIPEKPVDFSSSSSSIEIPSFDDFTPGSGMPPVLPLPVTLSWSNDYYNYHMIVVECIEDDPELITESTDRPPRLFRNMPTLETSQSINAMSFSYYGNHQIILYQLNPEYAALYEQLGTSSLDITAPPSNIENGLGIFTGINSDTLYLDVIAQ